MTSRVLALQAISVTLWATVAIGLERPVEEIPSTVLVGRAILPASTWSTGPPSGEYDGDGRRFEKPRFPSQPIQGFSSLRWREKPSRAFVLSDNGFGGRVNSADYLLRIYDISLDRGDPRRQLAASIEVEDFVPLNDRNRLVPFRIIHEVTEDRLLTGADFDPESMVVMNDGTFWVGDEFGPFLLHFGADGTLLEPPYPLEVEETEHLTRRFRSPQNPTLLAKGAAPEVAAMAEVAGSGGFEGLALGADGQTLIAMLEKGVSDDPYRTLRMFEFDLEGRSFTGRVHLYRLSGDRHRVGELTHIGKSRYLVVERDDQGGALARFKRIFQFDLEVIQPNGCVEKLEVADLLHIRDPDHLATTTGVFDFPFVTIESVELVDAQTLLVGNDNNFDSTGDRGEDVPNDNELIWIRLSESLR